MSNINPMLAVASGATADPELLSPDHSDWLDQSDQRTRVTGSNDETDPNFGWGESFN